MSDSKFIYDFEIVYDADTSLIFDLINKDIRKIIVEGNFNINNITIAINKENNDYLTALDNYLFTTAISLLNHFSETNDPIKRFLYKEFSKNSSINDVFGFKCLVLKTQILKNQLCIISEEVYSDIKKFRYTRGIQEADIAKRDYIKSTNARAKSVLYFSIQG
jgi:hypothetical protein